MEKQGCVKCGTRDAATKEVSMASGGIGRFMGISPHLFIVVYCKKCGYSEFYNKESTNAANAIDIFFG